MTEIYHFALPPKTILGYRKNGKPIYPIAGASEPFEEGVESGTESQGTGGNPAWQEFLDVVPQELHEKVTPVLQKWDQGVQERFQKVHSTYEPWKPLIEGGVDPDQAQFGLQLLDSINNDPQMVYNAIGEYYNLSPKEVQDMVEQGQDESGEEHQQYEDPRISELERQNRIMAQVLLQNQQNEQEAKAAAELDSELNSVQKEYGKFDDKTERIILSLMANNNMSGKEAAELYFSNIENAAKSRMPKPLIMGGGGGVPNQTHDVRKMSDSETRSMVAQYLKALNNQT